MIAWGFVVLAFAVGSGWGAFLLYAVDRIMREVRERDGN